MNLNSKRLSLADVRLKIFSEMEADLEARFRELLKLRERVRRAEQTRASKACASCHRRSRLACAAGEIDAGGSWRPRKLSRVVDRGQAHVRRCCSESRAEVVSDTGDLTQAAGHLIKPRWRCYCRASKPFSGRLCEW